MRKTFTDQLNRTIQISDFPKRIVSLVPSQTELLYDLGLENEIVGITRFCIHPKTLYDSKTKVGGTKNYKIDKIRALKPNLIIANKEENDKESLEILAQEFPVWISDIKNLEEAYEMIIGVGEICNKKQKSEKLVLKIKSEFKKINHTDILRKVVYLIWQKPYMSINKNTFIYDMLEKAGFQNVFKNSESRYPEISIKDIKTQNPEYIFLSSEPYPFKENHVLEFEKQFPDTKIKIVDGEMFSWYGSRLLKFRDYIKKDFF